MWTLTVYDSVALAKLHLNVMVTCDSVQSPMQGNQSKKRKNNNNLVLEQFASFFLPWKF